MELELLQQTAQQLGIAPSHYDIDGRLIYASPETLSHFVELLKPVENKCRREEFDDVLACFENEPINYDVERIALTEPIISLELLDENSTSITQKITQNSTALSLPPLSFGYYQLLLSTKSHHYLIRLPVSPKSAFQPPVLKHNFNVQFYSLRSQSNWGIGDFGDLLAYSIEQSAKQALINSLHRDHYLPPDYEGDALSMAVYDNLNLVIHRYLPESESKWIGIQPENLLNQEVVFNLPDTLDEYPNWCKKLAQPLESISTNESLQTFFVMINDARKV